jgi:antimicrobial peptide system protein, SdpB family
LFKQLDQRIFNWVSEKKPWTNVYGMTRSIIALSTLVTLLFNDVSTFFKPVAGFSEYPACSVYPVSIFCFFPKDYMYLTIAKYIAIVLLAIVASGWRPRITGVLHWWIASSIQNTAVTLDGGEQVAVAMTFLLLPVTLLDNRKWHWQEYNADDDNRVHAKLISVLFLFAIKIQLSIIYFHAAIAKIVNPEWVDGTAFYYYIQDPMLGTNPILLKIIWPLISSPFVVFITWGTIILELLLGAAIFAQRRFQRTMMYFGFGLHISIAILMGLYSFSAIMCASLLLALRPTENHINMYWIEKTKEAILVKIRTLKKYNKLTSSPKY